MEKSIGHSVFLLRSGFEDPNAALEQVDLLQKYNIAKRMGFEGTIFVGPQKYSPPNWLAFLNKGSSQRIADLFNASTRAVVLVKSGRSTLAWTFGFGRHLLREESYEKDFGLKVTLNSVQPDRLRSIDKAQIQEYVRQTRTQSSRASSIANFGVDPAQDLLRAVAGETLAFSFAKMISGESSIHFTSKMEFAALGGASAALVRAYRNNNYKNEFPWVDNMQPIRDRTKVAELDSALLNQIKSGTLQKLHLAPPEIFNWDNHGAFSFSNSRKQTYRDLLLRDYLNGIRRLTDLSIQQLKTDYILAEDAITGEFEKQWSVYKSLVAEIASRQSLYILALGSWFAIEPSYARRVKNQVRAIHNYGKRLPKCKVGEKEGEYNQRVADLRNDLILLDKKNIKPDDAHSPIEPCDLLSDTHDFIHVKRRGSSSTLSHLFSQGRISASTLKSDASFLIQLNAFIESETQSRRFLIPKRFKAEDITVVYAAIIDNDRPFHEDLPFFSLVNLVQAAGQLRLYGFKVAKLKIEIE